MNIDIVKFVYNHNIGDFKKLEKIFKMSYEVNPLNQIIKELSEAMLKDEEELKKICFVSNRGVGTVEAIKEKREYERKFKKDRFCKKANKMLEMVIKNVSAF